MVDVETLRSLISSGKVKTKGAYEVLPFEKLGFHKNHSAMVIPMAVAIADARAGKRGERVYSARVPQLLELGLIAFKSSTYMIVISGFIEPVLYLLSFGLMFGQSNISF